MPVLGTTAANPMTGGQNYCEFFDLTCENSVYTIGASKFVLNLIEDAKIDRQDNGTIKASFNQLEDSAELYTFIDEYAVQTAEGSKDVTLENGKKITIGSASAGKMLLMVNYGGKSPDGKIKTTFSAGTLDNGAGSFTQKYGDASSPSFGFTGIRNLAAITIPQANFATAIVAPTEDCVIPKEKSFLITFLPAKTGTSTPPAGG